MARAPPIIHTMVGKNRMVLDEFSYLPSLPFDSCEMSMDVCDDFNEDRRSKPYLKYDVKDAVKESDNMQLVEIVPDIGAYPKRYEQLYFIL